MSRYDFGGPQFGPSDWLRLQTQPDRLDAMVDIKVDFYQRIAQGKGLMALNIKNEEAYRLVQALADETGETLTEAVTVAVRERLTSLQRKRRRQEVVQSVRDLQEFVGGLPDLDRRSPDEILAYDEFGLPQ
jgi:antitoxin VapB